MNNIDAFHFMSALVAVIYIPTKVYTSSLTSKLHQKFESDIPTVTHFEWAYGMVLAFLALLGTYFHFTEKAFHSGLIQIDSNYLESFMGVLEMFCYTGISVGLSLFFFAYLPSYFGKKTGAKILNKNDEFNANASSG